jgi:hypothetical protein
LLDDNFKTDNHLLWVYAMYNYIQLNYCANLKINDKLLERFHNESIYWSKNKLYDFWNLLFDYIRYLDFNPKMITEIKDDLGV